MRSRARRKTDQKDGEFAVKDCALIAIATGRKVLTLKELREALAILTPASIYHHFWGGLLEPRFEEREYNNDFAAWVRHSLHDLALAERLAVLDPTAFADLEALRQELLDLMDQRMDENESLALRPAVRQLELIRSQIVVFDTRRRLREPRELAEQALHLSAGSIFYHFIDARRRPPQGVDDFSVWLAAFGSDFDPLCAALGAIDPSFGSVLELREAIAETLAPLRGEASP